MTHSRLEPKPRCPSRCEFFPFSELFPVVGREQVPFSRRRSTCGARPTAFTLVELLVVLAIIGLLVGLLLPAVQYSRETARRMTCSNHLKQQVLAGHQFHDAHRTFPAGCYAINGLEHSWCTSLLPYVEQASVAQQFDLTVRWDHPSNAVAINNNIAIFRCPSSVFEMNGDTDYAGIKGSGLTGLNWSQAFNSGVLVHISPTNTELVRFGDIVDGSSNTICIAESADRDGPAHGRWADGLNTISHDNGGINVGKGEIFSLHRGGAFVGRADGSVTFLPDTTDKYVVGALCTRNGGEIVNLQF